jgi:isoleucyl-tRNA synthetase
MPFAQAFERFIDDDLSTWYVRRSRRRFWKSEEDGDKAAAYWTLYRTLLTVTRLVAPILPFLAEEMYQNLARSHGQEVESSVHLTPYPEVNQAELDLALEREVGLVQKVVELGRAARSVSKVKVRQPLQSVSVAMHDHSLWPSELEEHVREELNVKEIRLVEAESLAERTYKANLPLLGPRLGSKLRDVRIAIESGTLTPLPDGGYEAAGERLSAGEVLVTLKAKPGYEVAGDQDVLVAIDTSVTPELLAEGRARDISRRINEMRKEAGFDIQDRINIRYEAGPELTGVLESHKVMILQETLGVSLKAGHDGSGFRWEGEIDGLPLSPEISRA